MLPSNARNKVMKNKHRIQVMDASNQTRVSSYETVVSWKMADFLGMTGHGPSKILNMLLDAVGQFLILVQT